MTNDQTSLHDEGPKGQHTVPESYLKAWGDPTSTNPLDRYVWSFPKETAKGAPKPPAAIFKREDFYTIRLADGSRDLRLEHGLATLEDRFCAIRDEKLVKQLALSAEDYEWVCAFVAAMQARTPLHVDHFKAQFGEILERMRKMREWGKTATTEERRAAFVSGTPSDGTPGLSIEDVESIVAKPVETHLPTTVSVVTPILMQMNMLVLNAAELPGFITSDAPCVWFDPEGYKLPPFYRAPGLGSNTVEVRLPVSPQQMIVFLRRGRSGYVDVPVAAVDEMNRLTRAYADKYFVVNSKVAKPVWFDLGVEPEDSWEKTEGRKWRANDD